MSTPAQGGQPELSGQVMFYRKPEPLSLERHRNLGVKQIAAPFSFHRSARSSAVCKTCSKRSSPRCVLVLDSR